MTNLSSNEVKKLTLILDYFIPKNDEMPGGSIILINLDYGSHIIQEFIISARIICEKLEILNLINSIDTLKKMDFRLFSEFVNLFLILYYSNTNVLRNLNVGSIPPFPVGNNLKQGDIYLLEQVYLKEKIYRD